MPRNGSKKRLRPTLEAMEPRDLPTAGLSPVHLGGVADIAATVREHNAATNHVVSPRSPAPGAPEFGTVFGRINAQLRAANAFLALEKVLLAAVPAPKLVAANGAIGPELSRQAIGQTLNGAQNDVIERIYNIIGPADPFASLPVMQPSALEPGDIIVSTTNNEVSQAIRIGTWSRYSHSSLYIGNGNIVDATGPGVRVRPLADQLSSATAVGVLRYPDLSNSAATAVVRVATAQRGKAYNYLGLAAVGLHKTAAIADLSNPSFGAIVSVLSRAERVVPDSIINNGTFFCSQLITFAYRRAGISLTQANGAAPGDLIRLGNAGALDEVGRLPVGAAAAILPHQTSTIVAMHPRGPSTFHLARAS